MRLMLDIGNSRLKWGLVSAGRWVAQGALDHDEDWDFPAILPPPGQLAAAHGVNVAGVAAAEKVQAALAPWAVRIRWLVPSREACGVRNAYDPTQLGADRWAAVLGGRHVHEGAALVVTAGTATTIDMLDEDGVFAGGLIIPGLELMKRSLATNTAGLPFADGVGVPIPTRTVDAIHMGCLHAQAGAIERMFRHLAGQREAICLVNGGAGPQIVPLLELPCRIVDNLVLEGVAVAAASDEASDGLRSGHDAGGH